jgi:hypothetical protein
MTRKKILLLAAVFLLAGTASATIFGSVRGIVHDPQHRPLPGATVTLRAANSDWEKTTSTDQNG